jgi:hypothetical protein
MAQLPEVKVLLTFDLCSKCMEVPCSCGWMYRDMGRTERVLLAAAVLGLDSGMLESIPIPEAHPRAGEIDPRVVVDKPPE